MRLLFFIPLLIIAFSCEPTKITQSWTAKDIAPKKYKKVLVLGVMTDNDIDLQVKMENHLADEMRELGYLAIAENKIFPIGTFSKGDTTKALEAINGKGFDAILTIVLLDKEKDKYYVPGKITDYSDYNNLNRFNLYYNTIADKMYTPGYFGEETKYVWENNFYDLNNKKMIYSARTRSFDITSKNTLAHSYGQLLVQNLLNKNILLKPDSMEEK